MEVTLPMASQAFSAAVSSYFSFFLLCFCLVGLYYQPQTSRFGPMGPVRTTRHKRKTIFVTLLCVINQVNE